MNPLEIYFAILVHFDIVYVQGLSNREGMSSNSAVTLFHSALSLQSPYNIYDNEIIGIPKPAPWVYIDKEYDFLFSLFSLHLTQFFKKQ